MKTSRVDLGKSAYLYNLMFCVCGQLIPAGNGHIRGIESDARKITVW